MISTNIIQRRDLEPLWFKANEVIRYYEKAADCVTAVIGADCIAVENSKHPKATLFCQLCKRYYSCSSKLHPYDTPCSSMHRIAVKKAPVLGGSFIYKCPVGILYWTSSFFSGERFAGAFISSVMPLNGKQEILDKIFKICKGNISKSEIAQHIEEVPVKTCDEIQALARMMLLCAEYVSYEDSRQYKKSGNLHQSIYFQDIKDKERLLIACLRRGDIAEAQNIARNLISDLVIPGNVSDMVNIDYIRAKAIELAVLLSRAGASPENNDELIDITSRYLKRISESNNTVEVSENLCIIIGMMAGKIFSFQGIRHASALRKAERFIRENFTRKISLREIAGESGLSAPYFSTIFKEEMGENLSYYLNRLRVEKASSMLRETDFPISRISTACGFEDQSWFSKIFKSYTGISPCKYRGCTDDVIPDTSGIQHVIAAGKGL